MHVGRTRMLPQIFTRMASEEQNRCDLSSRTRTHVSRRLREVDPKVTPEVRLLVTTQCRISPLVLNTVYWKNKEERRRYSCTAGLLARAGKLRERKLKSQVSDTSFF